MPVVNEPAFPENAYAILIDRFHRPFFLEKLARDWNIVPQNAAEEQQLLEAAATLRQQKEASEQRGGNSFLTEAFDSLKTAVAGAGGPAGPTSYDRLVKQAASHQLQDAEACQAVETWGAYLGQLAELGGAA